MYFPKTLIQAVCLLTTLHNCPSVVATVAWLAEVNGLPFHHAAKIMQALAKAGLVQSVRGRRGGYRFGERSITLREVMSALGIPTAHERLRTQLPDEVLSGTGFSQEAARIRLGTLARLIDDELSTRGWASG